MLHRSLLPLTAFILAACGTQPTAEDYDDIATSVGALVSANAGGEAEAVDDAVAASTGQLPPGFTQMDAGTLVGKRGTLDYSFDLTCLDAGGATQPACDDGTDQAHLVLHWNGDVDTARWDATLVRDGDWTLTGIQSGVATFDGTGSFDVDSEFMALNRPVSSSFQLQYDARYTGVQIRVDDRVILSGAITYEIHAQRTTTRRGTTKDQAYDVVAEVTFPAEGVASIVLDGVRAYEVDLRTGEITPAT